MIKSKSVVPFLLFIVAAIVVLPVVINLVRGPAQTPGVFSQAYSLAQGTQLSQETGKPMFVLATADWCPPCQKLKRSALADSAVIAWINENTIPVYLEDGTNGDQIASLGVRSYPTTMLVREGEILNSIPGAHSASNYLSKLDSAIASTP